VKVVGIGIRAAAAAIVVIAALVTVSAQGRGAAPPAGPPPTPRAGALFDITGYWVSLVTEDWRYRQFTPAKGDYVSIPINPAGRKIADAWDPAKDEAAGEQCKAFGPAGVMRLPTRLQITWQDDRTLKLEADSGTQSRTFGFGQPQGASGTLQGVSVAAWDQPRGLFASPIPNRGGPTVRGGSLKVVTTNMKPGYLRKNGVPYSAGAVLTEYYDRFDVPGGDSLLMVTAELVDPEYLTNPYWTSTHFKRQNDATGWRPTPCSAR
jgi:hypothetical protein